MVLRPFPFGIQCIGGWCRTWPPPGPLNGEPIPEPEKFRRRYATHPGYRPVQPGRE